jgi:arginyl-tRNA--protein-N-Asp/Glu arginylyltransferase
MKTLARWKTGPERCAYLPDRRSRQEYVYVYSMDADEYAAYLLSGWRRFGRTLFRPRCPGCDQCRSLRVDVARFRPDRSQRRCRNANEGSVRLRVGAPAVTPEKMALLDGFHADRSRSRGWPRHDPVDVESYVASFVDNPLPTQEWCYYLGDVLVGIGHVDVLAQGLSAIYFAHDPAHGGRSLGTWNVLSLLDRASALGLPHVYLGYYVAGCRSMRYKARFRPNQVLDADGCWRDRLSGH